MTKAANTVRDMKELAVIEFGPFSLGSVMVNDGEMMLHNTQNEATTLATVPQIFYLNLCLPVWIAEMDLRKISGKVSQLCTSLESSLPS